MKAANEARKLKILDTQIIAEGGYLTTRRLLVEDRVKHGADIKIVRGERVLMSKCGRFLDALNITKTAIDYAAELISNNPKAFGMDADILINQEELIK